MTNNNTKLNAIEFVEKYYNNAFENRRAYDIEQFERNNFIAIVSPG